MLPRIPPKNQDQAQCQWAQLRYDNVQILVVDDDPVLRFVMKELLEMQNATVYEAENGQEAVDIFEKSPLDIILMDINMPVMNGFEAIVTIRQKLKEKFIPIITINAFDDEGILKKALNCGADDYMVKPVNNDVLIVKINSMLRIKELYDKEHVLRMLLHAENQRSKELSVELLKAKKSLEAQNRQLTNLNQQLNRYGKELENEVIKQTSQLRQKDLELLEKDREVSLYTLASGMAHEINNPLGFVKSSLLSLGKRMNKIFALAMNNNIDTATIEKERQIKERTMKRAFRGINRISDLIDHLKRFSNVDMQKTGPLDLTVSINDNLRLIKSQVGLNYPSITTHFAEIPEIICTRQEINICLYNVLKNAIDAIKVKQHLYPEFNKGHIEIITRYIVPPPAITVEIIDNGIGMTDDEIRQAFVPFYTQKPIGEGSGVGLTMADTYMRNHCGKISINSEKNKGTTVTLNFPVSEKHNKIRKQE